MRKSLSRGIAATAAALLCLTGAGLGTAWAEEPGPDVETPTAKAPAAISNVTVTNTTKTTADVTFDYTFNNGSNSLIEDACAVVRIVNVTEVTRTGAVPETAPDVVWQPTCSPSANPEEGSDAYNAAFGVNTKELKDGEATWATAKLQSFIRVTPIAITGASGTASVQLIGLQPGTRYADSGLAASTSDDALIYEKAKGMDAGSSSTDAVQIVQIGLEAVAPGTGSMAGWYGQTAVALPAFTTASDQPTTDTIPVHRLFNEKLGVHVYSSDLTDEIPSLVEHGWTDEGEAFSVVPKGKGSGSVWRLYQKASGRHLFSSSIEEVNNLVKNAGWTVDDVAFDMTDDGPVEVRRLYNGVEHLYSASVEEIDTLVADHGWTNEGLLLNAWKN